MDFFKTKNNVSRSLLAGFIIILSICFIACDGRSDNSEPTQESRIEHLVLFKFKPTITSQEKQEVINRFMALNNSLKDGKRYVKIEYGFQNSMVAAKGNYDVGFRVTFKSLADRDYYVGKIDGQPVTAEYDKMHDAFKNFVGPYLDVDDPETKGVLVFDYTSNEKGNGSIPDSGYRLDHWTLFKLKAGVSQEQKQEIINGFLALKNSNKNGTPYVTLIEYGRQNSKEGAERGFELGFRVSFTSEADRNYYEGKHFLTEPGTFDPNHDKYRDFVTPFLDKVLVYDYEVKRE
ncbi:Dabb family protein [Elizabethkingia anophelis]|uniref:Dabb family protein n=1 Tax=Elizabethkingia anophelis TaxID=1117645 RepID=UPI00136B9DA1|nr:Dabb family protein [Elizabethkingia anophelis]MYY43893.1 Dabb family protein [Elizabethkingia anophelis]